jgi:site-specific recombinase XerD
MPGLSFDDGPSPDPSTPLVTWLDDWVTTLAARKSPRTAAGYLSDVAKFGQELLRVVGTPLPAILADKAAIRAACEEPSVQALVAKGVGAASLVRARAVSEALELADLAPRNLGVVLDRLEGAPATVLRSASAWSSLCAFLVRRGVLAANPMDHPAVERPDSPDAAPAPLSYAEVERLFDEVSRPDPRARQPWPARDEALAATLLSTGVRTEEVITAKLGDLEALEVSPRLRVFGKGAKTRVIPLHDEACARLRSYLDERVELLGAPSDDDPLFVRNDGSAFTPSALRRLVERWYVRAGVRRHPGTAVHALRHTWATIALDAGASIVEVQAVLGHESLEATKRYLKVVGGGLEQTMASHPSRELLRRRG